MSSCPAYLGLAIFDAGAAAAAPGGAAAAESGETGGQRSSSTLLRSDLLIFCPSNFTVSVRLASPPFAAPSDAGGSLHSVVVRLSDSGSSTPLDVRLTRVGSNSTADDRDRRAGSRRGPSPAPSEVVADFAPGGGGVLIAIAITGALLIAVYVGRTTATATGSISGTPLRPSLIIPAPDLQTRGHVQYKCVGRPGPWPLLPFYFHFPLFNERIFSQVRFAIQ